MSFESGKAGKFTPVTSRTIRCGRVYAMILSLGPTGEVSDTTFKRSFLTRIGKPLVALSALDGLCQRRALRSLPNAVPMPIRRNLRRARLLDGILTPSL